VRKSLVGFALVALVGARAAPAAAQGIVTDARRIGMGGLILQPSGLRRYNAAYRAVPARKSARGQPKITIPIPLGVIQFFHDHPNVSKDPAFNPDSTGFNPVLVLNTILNLPLYYEVKKAPTPTNDVVFGIGKDSLRVNLGEAAKLVPEDEFGIGGSSRPLDPGISIKGVRVSVMVGVLVAVRVRVMVGVLVRVGVMVGVLVLVRVRVALGVLVGVRVGPPGVMVGVGVKAPQGS